MGSDQRRDAAGRALPILGVVALAVVFASGLGACRGDLVAPSPPATSDAASMVQPYVRLLLPDAVPPGSIRVETDSDFYRDGAGRDNFSVAGSRVFRFPEPVRAPFLLEVSEGDRAERLFLDVFPAPAETIVVDFRSTNVRLRMQPPEGIDAANFTVRDPEIRVRFSNRSAHAEVDRSVSTTRILRGERSDAHEFRAAIPADVDSVWYLSTAWRVTDPHSSSRLDGRITYERISFDGELDLTLVSSARVMDLRVFWRDGAFEVEDFEYEVFAADDLEPAESVSVVHRAGIDGVADVGLLRPMRLRVAASRLSGILPWDGRIQWNGEDPLILELGRHALRVRVLDAEGQPVVLRSIQLERAIASWGTAEQSTDEQGWATFYVNDGEYVAYLSGQRYADLAPRGGPWRVTSDTTQTWVIP